MGILINIEDLRVRYGRRDILNGISLEVEEGEVCALLGRNGAGKSSLIRCLLGAQRPQRGTCSMLGFDSWHFRAELMARIGVVPEEADTPPHLTAKRLAAFGRQLYKRWDNAKFSRRLERFEVPDDVSFKHLSKGQKNQVMLAFALAPGPQLLVLDDPTLGLDAVARQAVFEELVVELADRGTTTFLTSHDMAGVESLATQVAFLKGGKLIVNDDLERLKGRFRRLTLDRDISPETLAPFAPIAHRAIGRKREVLISSFDETIFADWQNSLDRPVAPQAVSLEDIFVATAGERDSWEAGL